MQCSHIDVIVYGGIGQYSSEVMTFYSERQYSRTCDQAFFSQ